MVGDTVNLAARLMSAAVMSSDIYTDEETKVRTSGIAFNDLGLIIVKGKQEPVRIFQPIGKKSILLPLGLSTMLVGREKERAKINKYIDDLISGNGGCTLSITGGIGMGKSSLLAYIMKKLRSSFVSCYNQECYELLESGEPLRPFRSIFMDICGVSHQTLYSCNEKF